MRKSNYTFPSDTSVLKTLNALDIPNVVAVPILRSVKNWIVYCGPEYAVKRLKALKQNYVNSIAGVEQTETWISYHSDGTPSGPFRWLWKGGSSRKVRVKTLNALMIYTGVKVKQVTDTQWEKFVTSFTRKESWVYPPLHKQVVGAVYSIKDVFQDIWSTSSYDDPRKWCSNPSKSTSVFVPYKGLVKGRETDFPLDNHLMMMDLSNEGMPRRRFPEFYEKLGYTPPEFDLELRTEYLPTVGSIAIIQERGCKARIVANPYRVHQMALEKLGRSLFDLLKRLHWDCTHDQQKGIDFCAKNLREGRKAHCIDLRDATNNFPVAYQIELLRHLNAAEEYQRSLTLFEWISRNGLWRLPDGVVRKYRKAYVRCTQGQPLGLYPSFASFALSHGLIIRGIEQHLGMTNTFVVLGDDVVIFDEKVYKAYIHTLTALDIPISWDKTIISSEIAEFAGKIIDKFGLLRVEKWKGFSYRDPLSLFRWLGHKASPMVPGPLKPIVYTLVSMPEPLGLGLNPYGASASERLEALDDDYLLRSQPIQDDKEAERQARSYELHVAFGWSSEAERCQKIMPPPFRQEKRLSVEDHLMIDHINATIKWCGFLPEELRTQYEELRRKKKLSLASQSSESTRSILDVLKLHLKKFTRYIFGP